MFSSNHNPQYTMFRRRWSHSSFRVDTRFANSSQLKVHWRGWRTHTSTQTWQVTKKKMPNFKKPSLQKPKTRFGWSWCPSTSFNLFFPMYWAYGFSQAAEEMWHIWSISLRILLTENDERWIMIIPVEPLSSYGDNAVVVNFWCACS